MNGNVAGRARRGWSDTRRSAGGVAASGGIGHEDRCLAWAAAYMLAEERLPEWASGRRVVAVGAQTERPVDDVAVVTDEGGWVTIQAKKRLKIEERIESPLADAFHQLVEVDNVGVPRDPSDQDIFEILDPDRDRVLILTDDGAPRTIDNELAPVIDRLRHLPDAVPVREAARNEREERALRIVREHLARSWTCLHQMDLSEADFRRLTKLLCVRTIRLTEGGAERREAILLLQDLAQDTDHGRDVWHALEIEAHDMAERRLFADRLDLVKALDNRYGLILRPVARLRGDVTRLQERTATNKQALVDKATITAPEGPVSIPRQVPSIVLEAEGNVAITGAPGSGKSVMLHSLASEAASAGADLVVLRSNDLHATAGATRVELNLTHDLGDVLAGWTGTKLGLVLIDGLDQDRIGDPAAWLPDLAKRLSESRWRIIATIRTFDLKHSPRWKSMFAGAPVAGAPTDRELTSVRHTVVGDLTSDELDAVRTASPRIARLLDGADPRLHRLLTNPYNLDLAGQLFSDSAAELHAVRGRVDLLHLYWRSRVRSRPEHVTREQALKEVVARIISTGRQVVNPVDLPGHAAALVQLRHNGVLRDLPGHESSPAEQIAFTHQVLFDYAAAVLQLGELSSAESLAEVLDDSPNLAIATRPSLEYRLAIAWRQDGSRREYWRLALRLASTTQGHVLVAHVAARVAAHAMDTVTDVEELADACRGVSVDPHGIWGLEEARRVAFLLAAAISRHPEPAQPLNVLAPFTCTLAQHARSTDDVDLALLAAQLPRRSVNDPSLLTAEEVVRRWADVAVDSISVALAGVDDPARAPLARVTSWLLAVVAAHEPDLVSDVVRAVIASAGLEAWGTDAVWPLIERTPEIAAAAPDLAVMIGASVWEYEETRDVSTPLLDSSILGMVSNRKQDLESARYAVGGKYAGVMDVNPVAACRLLLHVVERPRMYPWSPSRSFDNPPYLRVGSALTYSDGYHSLDEMVNTFVRGLDRLASASNADAQEIVVILLADLRHGELWRRILYDAARSESQALGRLLFPVLLSPNVYAFPDTWSTAAHLATRLSPSLNDEEHAQLETAILSAPQAGTDGNDPEEVRRHLAERARTILDALDPARRGDAACAALEASVEQPEPLPNLTPALRDPYRFVSLEEEPPQPGSPENLARIVEMAEQRTRDQDANTRENGIAELLSAWQTIVANPDTSPDLWDLKLRVAARLARLPQTSPGTHVGDMVYDALSRAFRSIDSPTPDVDAEWIAADLPGYGTTPHTYAIQGLVRLFIRDDWRAARGDEISASIVPLLDSPSAVYRYLVTCILPVLHPEPDALIAELERRLGQEPDRRIANYLMAMLAHLRHSEPQHVDQVLERLGALPQWGIVTADPQADAELESRSDEGIATNLLVCLAIRHFTPNARRVVEGWFGNPVNHAERVTRSTTYLRDLFNPAQPELQPAQERAFELAGRSLNQLLAAFTNAVTSASSDNEISDQGKKAVKVAENLAAELYFASGALDERRRPAESTPRGELRRFATLALPVLEALAEIHVPRITHYVVQTASHISTAEPRRALLVAMRAATGDQAYARELTGLDASLDLVRRYSAEHRRLVVGDAECTTAVRIMLESFVGLGWDRATQLLEELDDLFT
jgi:hypothetical protein